MFCKQCGKEVKDGTKFCGYCGAQMEQAGIKLAGQTGGRCYTKENELV